ncbi:MAG: GNAT family N-acetyltransferase [Pseudomonadales bacterium]|jgi:ribosomal protein S18 acetylase RimI-like enzyme|nr:GNAT family N-acetyltransferase [Pseudomonadales bacterium]MDP7594458.1 GNAT family N-acetyltransferase [Pseudomonadales bacterium]HJN50583.1 GNAT family N-acetyltransferase [Pseudomonadales bacterium]
MSLFYKRDLEQVDWAEMKSSLLADDFDNGRTPQQLHSSFANSYSTCIAYNVDRLIGTARTLSDGVCNAYVVDVWTLSEFRGKGIAKRMMELLLQELREQHVYLFTDDAVDFYRKIGFTERPVGMEIVIGEWLDSG